MAPSHALPGNIRRPSGHSNIGHYITASSLTARRRQSTLLRDIPMRAIKRKSIQQGNAAGELAQRQPVLSNSICHAPSGISRLPEAPSLPSEARPDVEEYLSSPRNSEAYVRDRLSSAASRSANNEACSSPLVSSLPVTPDCPFAPLKTAELQDIQSDVAPHSASSTRRTSHNLQSESVYLLDNEIEFQCQAVENLGFGLVYTNILTSIIMQYYQHSSLRLLDEYGMLLELEKLQKAIHNRQLREIEARAQLWRALILYDLGNTEEIPQALSDVVWLFQSYQATSADCFQFLKLFDLFDTKVWEVLRTKQAKLQDGDDWPDMTSDQELLDRQQWIDLMNNAAFAIVDEEIWPRSDTALQAAKFYYENPSADGSEDIPPEPPIERLQQQLQELRISNTKLRTDMEQLKAENIRIREERDVFDDTLVTLPGSSSIFPYDTVGPLSRGGRRDPVPDTPAEGPVTALMNQLTADNLSSNVPNFCGSAIDRWYSQRYKSPPIFGQSPGRSPWSTPSCNYDRNISKVSSTNTLSRRHSSSPRITPRVLNIRNNGSHQSSTISSGTRQGFRTSYIRAKWPAMNASSSSSRLASVHKLAGDDGSKPKTMKRHEPWSHSSSAQRISVKCEESGRNINTVLDNSRPVPLCEQSFTVPIPTSGLLSPTRVNVYAQSNQDIDGYGETKLREHWEELARKHTKPDPRSCDDSPLHAQHPVSHGTDSIDFAVGRPNARPYPLEPRYSHDRKQSRGSLSALLTVANDPQNLPLTDTPSPSKLKADNPRFEEHQEIRRRSLALYSSEDCPRISPTAIPTNFKLEYRPAKEQHSVPETTGDTGEFYISLSLPSIADRPFVESSTQICPMPTDSSMSTNGSLLPFSGDVTGVPKETILSPLAPEFIPPPLGHAPTRSRDYKFVMSSKNQPVLKGWPSKPDTSRDSIMTGSSPGEVAGAKRLLSDSSIWDSSVDTEAPPLRTNRLDSLLGELQTEKEAGIGSKIDTAEDTSASATSSSRVRKLSRTMPISPSPLRRSSRVSDVEEDIDIRELPTVNGSLRWAKHDGMSASRDRKPSPLMLERQKPAQHRHQIVNSIGEAQAVAGVRFGSNTDDRSEQETDDMYGNSNSNKSRRCIRTRAVSESRWQATEQE